MRDEVRKEEQTEQIILAGQKMQMEQKKKA